MSEQKSGNLQDRRQPPSQTVLSPELVARATQQLEREIRLVERWLAELEETSKDNPEALSARKTYGDMLQSRRDLLQALRKQP